MFDPQQMAAEIAAAKRVFEGVFARARACRNPLCRRRRVCLAGWGTEFGNNMLYHPTGGCPVMSEAEWDVIQLGIIRNRQRMEAELQAAREARRERDEPEASEKNAPAKAPVRTFGFAQALWMQRRDGTWCWPHRVTPPSWGDATTRRRRSREGGANAAREAGRPGDRRPA